MTLTTHDLRSELVPTVDVTAYLGGGGKQKIGVLTEKKFFYRQEEETESKALETFLGIDQGRIFFVNDRGRSVRNHSWP